MKSIRKFINTSSIRSQLFATVAIGFMLLLLSAIYSSTWVSNQQLRQVLIKQGKQATLNLSKNASLALLYDSPGNAEMAIQGTLAFPDVTGVTIYKADKTLFYRSDKNINPVLAKDAFNEKANSEPQIVYEDDNNWQFLIPVLIKDNNHSLNEQLFNSQLTKNEKLIGYVIVTSSKAKLKTIGKGILFTISAIASIISLLLLFALHKIIKRLTQPLYVISDTMRKTERGEGVSQISSNGPREVHQIAEAYNRMSRALAERDEALRKQNVHLERQAIHDHLTGLINRTGFEQALNLVIEECKTLDAHHVLCYMDLDKFKIVNDSCGHNSGDELLQNVSEIFTQHIRKESDTLARVGGDEFALILRSCSIEKARTIGEAICRQIENYRFNCDGRTYSIGVSIGITQLDENTVSMHDVVSRADSACYIAKEKGRGQVYVIQPGDENLQNLSGETQIASQIISHLQNNKFKLYCQLIKSLKNRGKTTFQYEILLRMSDKNGKNIAPDKFISSAERYDLMTRIDCWVISQTLQKLSENVHVLDCIDTVAININASSINDEHFYSFIENEFKLSKVNPQLICFELTETITLSNARKANDFIQKIHDLGSRISLDDFVSNSSSFSHIKNMHIDYLKIHGDFFKDISNNSVNHVMARSINEIAHILGIETIAEHIEDNASLKEVAAMGIDHAQGYIIGKPVPLNEILSQAEKN